MTKGLEAFDYIKITFIILSLLVKKTCIKILEIIVKKRIDIGELNLLIYHRKGEELKFYNSCRQVKYKLKQEEYDLLKEVLK